MFLVDDAIIVQQTDKSSNWCRGCTVWLIVNTIGDKRVQVTASAVNFNPNIDDSLPITAIIPKNQISCYAYPVLTDDQDVLFEVRNYQGSVDLFISALNQPTTTSSSSVKLLAKQ